MAMFKEFFDNIAESEFSPIMLESGDTPRSDDYNSNLKQIYNDILRFYKELQNLSDITITSFNYSQVVTSEIKKRAESLAGMVLDLNILNGFVRSDVIVAGDDFINLDNVNTTAGLGSSQAELISNGAGVSLARSSTNNLSSHPKTTIEVLPISPQTQNSNNISSVNTKPTPGNLNRFYEGNYYNFIGQARPEGGVFNIQFVADPKKIAEQVEGSSPKNEGAFLEYGASADALARDRRKMIDGDPDTFWECEYVVKLPNPLIPDVTDSMVIEENVESPSGDNKFSDPESPDVASIQIDVNDLNSRSLSQDSLDLIINIVVTLPEIANVNFVSINPVVFSKSAFIDVQDISTELDGQFVTVDGWEELRFPKTITPEANEYLTDSQLSASLSPTRYNYSGQGIYPFPNRLTKKVKIRLAMTQPAAQVYERTYALLKNVIDTETTITTTTKKGKLRF
jgi:hypothetical protein